MNPLPINAGTRVQDIVSALRYNRHLLPEGGARSSGAAPGDDVDVYMDIDRSSRADKVGVEVIGDRRVQGVARTKILFVRCLINDK